MRTEACRGLAIRPRLAAHARPDRRHRGLGDVGIVAGEMHQDRAATLAGLVEVLVDLDAVTLAEHEVDSLPAGHYVRVMVKDNGEGIEKQNIPRLFERFYRVDKARSRVTGGTGLGLSIVRHIVLEHGGSIEVVSEEGMGSTFTIRLPQVSVKPAPDLVDDLGALT